MTETLVWSDEARKVAQPLLWTTHARLADTDIRFAFTDAKIPSEITCKAFAKIGICTPRERLLAAGLDYGQKPADVLIVVNKALWDSLEPRQQTAVLDHTLCLPAGTVVTGPPAEASSTRWYSGQIVEITTAAGHFLSGTPNHPVLTARGWVALEFVHEGDHVLSSSAPERVAATMYPNEHQMPAGIEQVARSGLMPPRVMPEPAQDLYANGSGGDVDVVLPNRRLLVNVQAADLEHISEVKLGRRELDKVALSGVRDTLKRFGTPRLPADSILRPADRSQQVGFSQHAHAVVLGRASVTKRHASLSETVNDGAGNRAVLLAQRIRGGARQIPLNDLGIVQIGASDPSGSSADGLRFAVVSQRNAGSGEHLPEGLGVHAEFVRDRLARFPGQVALDKVIEVVRRPFDGHVYNLRTRDSWFFANGIVTHNCHIWSDEDGALSLRKHDISEFAGVLERQGVYFESMSYAVQVIYQLGAKAVGQ